MSIQLNNELEVAALAAVNVAAEFIAIKHSLPKDGIVAGLSLGQTIMPTVNLSVQKWREQQQIATQAQQYTPPPVAKPKPVDQPPKQVAPIVKPTPPQPKELSPHEIEQMKQNPVAYAAYCRANKIEADGAPIDRPAPIPSTLETPTPVAPPVVEQPAVTPVVEEKKKRGRPKKV